MSNLLLVSLIVFNIYIGVVNLWTLRRIRRLNAELRRRINRATLDAE